MSATKKSATKKTAAKKPAGKKLAAVVDFDKLYAAAKKTGATSFTVNDGVALHGFASSDRTRGDGKPSAKRELFAFWLKHRVSDIPATIKQLKLVVTNRKTGKLQPVSPASVRSWLANWHGAIGKAFFPCDDTAENRKLIAAAVARDSK